MINFDKYISEDGIKKVESAIASAESNTSCEIVPVIIDYADDYAHASVICGFVFSVISVILLWFMVPPNTMMEYFWSTYNEVEYLGILLFTMVISFVLGSYIADKMPSLKLFFLSPKNMTKSVINKSLQAFNNFHVGKTVDSTGIVIIIALYEKTVYVHGDVGVSKHFAQEHWDSVRDKIITGIKNNDLAQGLCDGIIQIGDVVSDKLPIKEQDNNELVNKLYFFRFYET